MNKNIVWVIVILIVVGLGAYMIMSKNNSSSTTTPAPTEATQVNDTKTPNNVTIANMAFSPTTLTVKVGDSVTWTNQDSTGHTATADDGTFDTGILDQNGSKAVKFDKAGTFTYHCTVHPSMNGTIIVK